MASPFARANLMMAAISAAMSLTNVMARENAMAQIGPYRSRGKGRGSRGAKWLGGSTRSKHMPHIGTKEQERAKRSYMQAFHGEMHLYSEHLRSKPVVHQMSKRQYAAQLAPQKAA
jgi:hypothetical protein